MSTTAEKCLVTIDGKQFDLALWKDSHPGGRLILEQYHDKDATDIFQAMHGAGAYEKLGRMKGTPVEDQTPERMKKFRELRQQFVSEGLFKSNPYWHVYKTGSTVGTLLAGIISVFYGYWLIGAILVGIAYQQLGWLAHDYCHHNVFENRKHNNFLAYFLGNICAGLSVNWWKDRHNTHHAITNVLDADPDVDNLPLFVWSEHDIHRIPTVGGLAEYIIPYQQYYFLAFTPLLKLIWCLQSFLFTRNVEGQNGSYMRSLMYERVTLGIHWSWVAFTMYMCGSFTAALLFFVISEFIGGAGIALVVFMNHYACEQLLHADGKKADFLALQLGTTRNMNPGVLVDWFAGGLNYQIEHHLFPTMPRHNLSKAKPAVEEFCRVHNIHYDTLSFWGCIVEVHKKLAATAAVYTKIVNKTE